MLSSIWNTLLVNPLLNILIVFYQLTGSLGVGIILLTVLVRLILVPVVIPSMRNMQKQKELQPELDKIRKKYKDDKKKQAEAQMALFKEHGLNPTSGCLTQLPMFIVLIAVYNVIRTISMAPDVEALNQLIYFNNFKLMADGIHTHFLYMDLAQPDPYYILGVLAGILQFLTSKLTFGFTKKAEDVAKKTPEKSDDIMYNMQEQMLYIMPIMTVVIGLTLPAGVVLYIVVTTLFSLVQTYFLLGGEERAAILKKIK